MSVIDTFGRPLRSLRISVTDRCNLRCQYCMPEQEYAWLPRKDLLDFEEISTLVDVFAALGVDKLRITGGEPLLRRNLPLLVKLLATKRTIKDLALTTNGVLLAEYAQSLRDAGLHRITVSIDTLRADRFRDLTRSNIHDSVLEGIEAATTSGFDSVKLDTVVIRGTNDDELSDLVEYAKRIGAEIRFIEYMDVGGATQWSMNKVVPREEILCKLSNHYGSITPVLEQDSAAADRFLLPDGTCFGIISSTTKPFCRDCDRSRLTADGLWFLCLYAAHGIDLRIPLRSGISTEDLRELITLTWQQRAARGAELRLTSGQRTVLISLDELQKEPHLEMHTRGG